MSLLVLPDSESARSLDLPGVVGPGATVLRHASGRPWIVGDWNHRESVVVDLHGTRVGLFGVTATTADELRAGAARLRRPEDIDALARALTGSHHLVVSINGHTCLQGSLSTARQFFHARVGDVTVAADRPQILARLRGSGVDRDCLALHLLVPFGAPWPLSERTAWDGVHALPGGHRLTLSADGVGRISQWWHLPEPDLSIDEGAERVAAALHDAVAARTGGAVPVCADLSGGMDSTSLAFVASEFPAPLVTVHREPLGASNDDSEWADRCRPHLADARHITIRRGAGPHLYSGLGSDAVDLEGPSPFARAHALYDHLAATVAATGARYHLGGVGGDELFQPTVLCLTALLRTDPLRALPHVRRFRHRYRWNARNTLALLARPRSFAQWLATTSDQLGVDRAWGSLPETDWEVAPRMPGWATPDAVDTVRRYLRTAAAEEPRPLADLPVHHAVLRLMQVNGRAMRMNNHIAERHGVSLEAPYADDRVIEAAMSVRLADRLADHHPKAVLARAMRGRVPHVFDRTTKGDSSAEIYEGLRHNRRDLEQFCDESLLAAEGLVDPEAMRRVLVGLHADARPLMPFDSTLGLELWWRAARHGPAAGVTVASNPHPSEAIA